MVYNAYRSDAPVNPDMLIMARLVRGYTQEYVAEVSGIPLETLQRYEAEGGVLPTGDIYKLARGYEFPITFFHQKGKIHRTARICGAHSFEDEMLEPLQFMLDVIVGDDKIANVEWGEHDAVYIRRYHTDDDEIPYEQQMIGHTLQEAERWLLKMLKAIGKA